MVDAVLRHRAQHEAGHPASVTSADDEQIRVGREADESLAGVSVDDHRLDVDAVDLGERLFDQRAAARLERDPQLLGRKLRDERIPADRGLRDGDREWSDPRMHGLDRRSAEARLFARPPHGRAGCRRLVHAYDDRPAHDASIGLAAVIRVEHSIVVDRTPAEVFAFLTDPANLPAWQGSCRSARADGPVEVGARITEKRSFLGREATSIVEVTELEPERLFTLEVVEGPVAFSVRHRLEPAGDGTRVTVNAEGEPGGVLRFGSRFVARAVEQETRKNFARLKTVLETRAWSPAPGAPRD